MYKICFTDTADTLSHTQPGKGLLLCFTNLPWLALWMWKHPHAVYQYVCVCVRVCDILPMWCLRTSVKCVLPTSLRAIGGFLSPIPHTHMHNCVCERERVQRGRGKLWLCPPRWGRATIKTARLFLLTGRNLSGNLVWGQCNNEHLVVGISNENTVSLCSYYSNNTIFDLYLSLLTTCSSLQLFSFINL